MVSTRVTNIMLHVADDGIRPICHVQCTIVPNFKISRAKIEIVGDKQIVGFRTGYVAQSGIERQLVLLDAQESDHIQYDKIAFEAWWKMRTRYDSAGRNRSNGILKELPHAERSVGVGLHLESQATGRVGSIVVAPVVEVDSMSVRRIFGVETEFARPRIETIHSGRARHLIATPRRFDVRYVEYAALVVQEPIGSIYEIVG